MLKISFILFFALVALFPEDSAANSIKCGAIPVNKVFKCIGRPNIFNSAGSAKCPHDSTLKECEIASCYAHENGWLEGSKLNKAKVTSDLDKFAHDNPAWASAIGQVKTECLGTDLSAQGIYLNCPAYDIYLCAISGLAKHASDSQWSSEADCQLTRTYAAACPACTEDCFATQIPIGSCNACLSLPRSP